VFHLILLQGFSLGVKNTPKKVRGKKVETYPGK
jgi:hypothetical protein